MAVAVAAPPGFWLQHATREAPELVALANDLAQGPHGRPGIAFGPVNGPNTLNPLFEQARNAGAAILDPQGHALDRPPTKRAQRHFPWLVQQPRPQAQTDWEQWMQRGLDHQLSTDLRRSAPPPSFVITPSPLMEASRGIAELYPVLDAADAVRSRVQTGTDCWLGVSVDRVYLRDEPHLTRLADAMVATPASGYVFRATHGQLAPVDDRRYLHGLREVVRACASNGIRIYLPNSGWLGWLAMGWGAWGFSAGMAASTWVDREPGPITPPDEPANPYFEPQLIRTVRWRVHQQQLSPDPSYQQCTCDDCTQMGGTHNASRAKRHQLRHAHAAAAAITALPPAQREAHVAGRLDDAIAFRDGLPAQRRARAGGDFLDRWRELV